MAYPRTPVQLAEATGAAANHPARFKDRADPYVPPIGDPPFQFGSLELNKWAWFVRTIWWVKESDRPLVEQCCKLWVKLDTGEASDAERGAFIRICGMLGLSASTRSSLNIRLPDEAPVSRMRPRTGEGA